jgi:tryptophanyl-tRNA synthetase
LLAEEKDTLSLREQYVTGAIGYGAAKTMLFDLILQRFAAQRAEYDKLISDAGALESVLAAGEKKASELADKKLEQVRAVLGY